MLEYWEAVGRLTYEKGLFSELEKVLGPPTDIPWITATNNNYKSACLNIQEKQFRDVQDFFSPILTEQLLSLVAAGELIWMFSGGKLRTQFHHLHAIVSKTPPILFGPSTSYFIALGIVIVDGLFRKKVEESDASCLKALPRLSDKQREQIQALFKNPLFKEALRPIESFWDEGCLDRLIPYPVYAQPVGANKDPKAADASGISYA
jgi:hypothetical protein